MTNDLATALYDMPETSEMPGIAESARITKMHVTERLQALNPGREHEIDQYFASVMPLLRRGCIQGVRSEISRRITAEFSPDEIKQLHAFSVSPSGSAFFAGLRLSQYGAVTTEPAASDQLETAGTLDGPIKIHLGNFYKKLMANEGHWLAATCLKGQSISSAELKSSLNALNLVGVTNSEIAPGIAAHEPSEIADIRFKAAVSAKNNGDFAKEFKLLNALSSEGNVSAKFMLAAMYLKGSGIPRDFKAAFALFSEGAAANDVLSEYFLGTMYLLGQGVPKDSNAAFGWFYRSAEGGYPLSELELANRYRLGDGVKQDSEKALMWHQRAADDGNAPAQRELGLLYQQGILVAQDQQKAAFWFQKAAEQGDAIGEFRLGLLYEFGREVLQDDSKSFELFKKAADQGLPDAQTGVGIAYFFGKGVPQDRAAAVSWYMRAADQGFADAQFRLGTCYENGDAVPKNMAFALLWYFRAANQGHGYAQYNLGIAFGRGNGVPVNLIQAFKWLALSASQTIIKGPDVAIKARNYTATLMSPGQIEEAKKLVADWRPVDVAENFGRGPREYAPGVFH